MHASSTSSSRFPVGASIDLEMLAVDPHPSLHRLRTSEPVSWVPALGGWLVTSRRLVLEAMRDDEGFTVDDPRFSTARIIGRSMLSTDGAEHRRHRAPFVGEYRKPRVDAEFGDWMVDKAERLVAGIASDGTADLKATVAAPLAVAVIVRSLGLDGVEDEEVLGWYRSIVHAVHEITAGYAEPPEGRAAFARLQSAVTETIATAGSALVSRAAASLTPGEVASNAAVLMFGAVETSEAALANVLWHLLTNRSELELVLGDKRLVADAVEESLRLEPAATSLDRYATKDLQLGDVTIMGSDYVVLSLAAANRDPAVFDGPDVFDVRRPNSAQHVTFAVGPHACLGIHLARLEAGTALRVILERLPNLRLVDTAAPGPIGLVFRKPEMVEVSWNPLA